MVVCPPASYKQPSAYRPEKRLSPNPSLSNSLFSRPPPISLKLGLWTSQTPLRPNPSELENVKFSSVWVIWDLWQSYAASRFGPTLRVARLVPCEAAALPLGRVLDPSFPRRSVPVSSFSLTPAASGGDSPGVPARYVSALFVPYLRP